MHVPYKWRRCSKKKCCKQCGQVKFMGTMTKWPVQKHTDHHKTRSKQGRNRHKEITIFLCFSIFLFFIFNFQLLKGLLQKMLIYRLGTVNENHWGFKPIHVVHCILYCISVVYLRLTTCTS